MPLYRDEDLEDLEIAAEEANPDEQAVALSHVVRVFEENRIIYGVMGGMNFYLRGSGRATGDVDIAVDNRPRMDALLDVFNNRQESVLSSSLALFLYSYSVSLQPSSE